MAHFTVPSAGGAMSGPSSKVGDAQLDRRTIMAATASAAILSFTPKAEATPKAVFQVNEIDRLWRRRLVLRAHQIETVEAYDRAVGLLPWWAAPGPSNLYADGSIGGHVVGWPAWTDMEPSKHANAWRVIRPSPHLFREQRENSRGMFGAKQTGIVYRRNMRKLISVLRAQRSEREKVGLPDLGRAQEVATNALLECENAIEAVRGATPTAVASRLLLALMVEEGQISDGWDVDDIDWPFSTVLDVLEDLRPSVGGVLRNHLDELFSDRSAKCRSLTFWRG